MILCVNCKHYKKHKGVVDTNHFCYRDAKTTTDPVTGEELRGGFYQCYSQRSKETEGGCGPDAKYFEPK